MGIQLILLSVLGLAAYAFSPSADRGLGASLWPLGVPGVARIRFSGFRVLQHRLRTTANGITAPVRLAIGPIGAITPVAAFFA